MNQGHRHEFVCDNPWPSACKMAEGFFFSALAGLGALPAEAGHWTATSGQGIRITWSAWNLA